MKQIRAVVVGCGNMGRIGVRFLLEKGIEIVGAYGVNPKTLGEDLGIVAGLEQPLGIKISSDLEALLEKTKPDVAVHAMFSTMEKNETVFATLLRHGVNIVTTCDDSHHAWEIEPEVTRRLDEIAKANDSSLIGTGIQDVFFLNIGHVAAGASVSLQEIEVTITNNADDYGLASAQEYGVGLTTEEFNKSVEDQAGTSSAMTSPINAAICAKFGLKPVNQTLQRLPYIKDHDVYSSALEKMISAGDAVGRTEQMITETAEGITIRCTYSLYIYDEDEIDITAWHLHGTPDCDIEIPRCKTAEGTMATLINRIPDAIHAAPGYYPDCELAPAQFNVGPFQNEQQ